MNSILDKKSVKYYNLHDNIRMTVNADCILYKHRNGTDLKWHSYKIQHYSIEYCTEYKKYTIPKRTVIHCKFKITFSKCIANL